MQTMQKKKAVSYLQIITRPAVSCLQIITRPTGLIDAKLMKLVKDFHNENNPEEMIFNEQTPA